MLSSYLLQVLWMTDGSTDYGWAGRTTDYQTDESDLADLMDQDFSFLFDDENFFVLLHDQNHVLMMQLFKDKGHLSCVAEDDNNKSLITC